MLNTPGSLQGRIRQYEKPLNVNVDNYRALLSVIIVSLRRNKKAIPRELTVSPGKATLAGLSGGDEDSEGGEDRGAHCWSLKLEVEEAGRT